MRNARRLAVLGMAVSGALAALKILTGLMAGSASVLADGFESAGDVAASALVLVGLTVAARPADSDHPYGHGRAETLTALVVGLMLVLAGAVISTHALWSLGERRPAPAAYAVWPLILSMIAKSVLTAMKFRYGKKIGSSALVADSRNDAVDILSAIVALAALSLTLHDPERFMNADRYGGFAVGLIVIFTGIRVARDTGLQLMDTMPGEQALERIRLVAVSVPGVEGVEKCYARKTGLKYHVDLHLEVDPEITVKSSHEIASAVRERLRRDLDWVADVLVHVEPAPRRIQRAKGM